MKQEKELLEFMKIMKKTDIWKKAKEDFETINRFDLLVCDDDINISIENAFKENKDSLLSKIKNAKSELLDDKDVKPETAEYVLTILNSLYKILSKVKLEKNKPIDTMMIAWTKISGEKFDYNSLEKMVKNDRRSLLLSVHHTGSNYVPNSTRTTLIAQDEAMDKNYWLKKVHEATKRLLDYGGDYSKLSEREIFLLCPESNLKIFLDRHYAKDATSMSRDSSIFELTAKNFIGTKNEYHLKKGTFKDSYIQERGKIISENNRVVIFDKNNIPFWVILKIKNSFSEWEEKREKYKNQAINNPRLNRLKNKWYPPLNLPIVMGSPHYSSMHHDIEGFKREQVIWISLIEKFL